MAKLGAWPSSIRTDAEEVERHGQEAGVGLEEAFQVPFLATDAGDVDLGIRIPLLEQYKDIPMHSRGRGGPHVLDHRLSVLWLGFGIYNQPMEPWTQAAYCCAVAFRVRCIGVDADERTGPQTFIPLHNRLSV